MMNATPFEQEFTGHRREELLSAHFSSLVTQQANMALMFLGQVPNPETSERMLDLESAQFFIDQLEMIGIKTHGNLTVDEQAFLHKTLSDLRMGFAAGFDQTCSGIPQDQVIPPGVAGEKHASAPEPEARAAVVSPELAAENEGHGSKVRFTKKYRGE